MKIIKKKLVKKVRPLGVTIISILFSIPVLLLVLITMFIILEININFQLVEDPIFGMFLFFSLIYTFPIFLYLIDGLWKGRNLARIISIIFCAVGIIYVIGGTISSIGFDQSSRNIFTPISVLQVFSYFYSDVYIILLLIIGYYLTFNKNVKNFFSQ